MNKLFLSAFAFAAVAAAVDRPVPPVEIGSGAPLGPCTKNGALYVDYTAPGLWACTATGWLPVAGKPAELAAGLGLDKQNGVLRVSPSTNAYSEEWPGGTSLSWTNLAHGSCAAATPSTVTFTGAQQGNLIAADIATAPPLFTLHARVIANDTVSLWACNHTGAPITLRAVTPKLRLFRSW